MSSIHILSGNAGVFSAVVHTPTPAGNNSAGVPWTTALVNSGMARTSLTIGVGPGQITQAEADDIAAGRVIEARVQWGEIVGADVPTLIADLDLRAQQAAQARIDQLATQLKFFGYVRP